MTNAIADRRKLVQLLGKVPYVSSEFIFSLLTHLLSPETRLGSTYTLDVVQGLLYSLDKQV